MSGRAVISDNGPQFIAKNFKEFIRIAGMTHVRTSPYYPQSNGKIERWHKTLKGDCIRVKVPLSLDEARRTVSEYITHYNEVRLDSAVGYVTPKDRLEGRDQAIHDERARKLAEARQRRQQLRQAEHDAAQAQPRRPSRPSISPPSAPPSPWSPSSNCSAAARPVTPAADSTAVRAPCTARPRPPAAPSRPTHPVKFLALHHRPASPLRRVHLLVAVPAPLDRWLSVPDGISQE